MTWKDFGIQAIGACIGLIIGAALIYAQIIPYHPTRKPTVYEYESIAACLDDGFPLNQCKPGTVTVPASVK